jgi:hypothetical protein
MTNAVRIWRFEGHIPLLHYIEDMVELCQRLESSKTPFLYLAYPKDLNANACIKDCYRAQEKEQQKETSDSNNKRKIETSSREKENENDQARPGFEPRLSLQLEPFTFCRALAATYTTILFFGVDLRFSITVYKGMIR